MKPPKKDNGPVMGADVQVEPVQRNRTTPVPPGTAAWAWEAIGGTRVADGWRYPEYDGSGAIIGWCNRYDTPPPGGPKVRAEKGSKRGLVLRLPLPPSAGLTSDDPIIIAEGVADTVAAIGLMFDAVGIPAAHRGGEYLAELLKGRHIAFMADADTAGRTSAREQAALLVPLCVSVRIVEPPAPHKDLRDWVGDGSAMRADVEELIARSEPIRPGQDSFAAPIEGERARNAFEAVPLSALGEDEPVQWVWPGYIARGHTSLLTALWKAGKTTLVAHLLRDAGAARGLAVDVLPIKVLVVSEESKMIWKRRRDDLGIGDHIHVVLRPFLGKPSPAAWTAFVQWAADQVKSVGYGLVVFDTLPGLWSVVQENDAGEVGAALLPLHRITGAGAAVLLVHHPRKGDAAEGQASRGSGALAGFVDTIIEMRRFAPEVREDRRRVLTVYSRFDEAPGETVLELRDDGYAIIGDKAEVRQADRVRIIEGLLPGAVPGLTADEVRDGFPEPRPGERTVRDDLSAGTTAGRWARMGAGRKGDPFRYWRGFVSGTLAPIGAGNESANGMLGGAGPENHP